MLSLFILSFLFLGIGILSGMISFPYQAYFYSYLPLLLSLPTLIIGIKQWGKSALPIFITLFGCFFFLETTSLLTGLPFGRYFYNDFISPKLNSLVPFFIPFYGISFFLGIISLLRFFPTRFFSFSFLLFPIAFLVLTPGAVAEGIISFERGGIYYGVPLMAIAGWSIVGFLLIIVWKAKINKDLPIRGVSSLLLTLAFWSGVGLSRGYAIPFFLGAVYTISIFLLSYAQHPRTRN